MTTDSKVLKLVARIRKDHPDMGLREMYHLIQPKWMGRDTFEALDKEHGFCVRTYKNFHMTTASSVTKFFPNLIEKPEIVRPNHV